MIQSVIHGPITSASSASVLEMRISSPSLALLNLNQHFNKLPGWFMYTLKSEKPWCISYTNFKCIFIKTFLFMKKGLLCALIGETISYCQTISQTRLAFSKKNWLSSSIQVNALRCVLGQSCFWVLALEGWGAAWLLCCEIPTWRLLYFTLGILPLRWLCL